MLLNLGLFLVSLATVIQQFADGGGLPDALWPTVVLVGWLLVLIVTAQALVGFGQTRWVKPSNTTE